MEPQRSAVLETVLRLGKQVTQATDLRSALLKIYGAARQGLGFDRASIWLHDPAHNVFRGSFGTNAAGERTEEWDLSYEAPTWGGMLSNPAWMLHTNNYPSETAAHPETMAGVHEHAAVAMWAGDTPVGTLCVDNLLTQRPLTEAQLSGLRLFAGYAGQAIANVRLLEEVRESEERFRALFEQAGDIILLLEVPPGGIPIIRDANAAASRLLGYERDELLGQPISLIEADPQAEDLIRGRRRGILSGEMSVFEVKHRRKNGTVFVVECSTKEIQVGPKTFAFSIERDITQRELAEAELRRQRAELQLILDSVPALIFYKDRAHRLVRVNEFHARCLNLPKDQIEGKTDAELGSPHAAKYIQDDLEIMTTGRPRRGIIEPLFTSTGTRWLQTDKVPFRDAHGNIAGLIGFAVDITERKQAEEALRASEVRYRRLFESAKDGILILDAETGTVVDANPFLIQMLGFSREQLIEKKVGELGFLKDIAANQAKFLELQAKEHVRYDYLPLETADGRRIEVEFVSNVYLVDHQKVIQCNIRDITARRQMEERMSQTEKLAVLGEMIADLAHAINNPLSVVYSNAQFLCSTFKDIPLERLLPHRAFQFSPLFIGQMNAKAAKGSAMKRRRASGRYLCRVRCRISPSVRLR
ncbi:MAG: PAS domain S-box protein, partial [Planctomycetota bacterium]|nr:PAS domain S-box protein [Planctomycetota bacterium]